jgi:GNAT superfamily N-acetyltransferase
MNSSVKSGSPADRRVPFAETDADVRRCAPALIALRPHLDEEGIAAGVRAQRAESYRLLYREADGRVVSAAGFRVLHTLAWGKVVYIDDLTTLPEARGQGHAGALLDEILQLARDESCVAVHLDSGFTRHDAHRLYLNKGFILSTHRFAHKF